MLAQFFNTFYGRFHALVAFKVEGLGHYAHRQHAFFLGGLGNDRRGAGSRAAAHACGDKDHIRIADGFTNGVEAFFRGTCADFRPCSGAEPAGQFLAELNFMFCAGTGKGLHIGVGANERYSSQLGVDHILYGVSTTAADAEYLDFRRLFRIDMYFHGKPL